MNIKNFFLVSALTSMFTPVFGMMWGPNFTGIMPDQIVQDHRQKRIDDYFKSLRKKIRSNCSIEEIEKWSTTQAEPSLAHWVVIRKQNDLLKKLLDKGLSPQISAAPKDLPIRTAIRSGNDPATQLLLEHDALITEVNGKGNTLLMETVSQLYTQQSSPSWYGSSQFNGMETLYQILEHKNGIQLINRKSKDGKSALGLALCGLSKVLSEEMKVSIHIVYLLIQHGENPTLAMKNDEVVKAIEKIEALGYKTFSSHMYEQYNEFKERCAAHLVPNLISDGPMNGKKEDENIMHGPFLLEFAVEFARYRFHCEASGFNYFNKQLEKEEKRLQIQG